MQAIADRLSFYDEAQADLDTFVQGLALSDESENSEPEHAWIREVRFKGRFRRFASRGTDLFLPVNGILVHPWSRKVF